jgi:hypothetical protein
MPVLFETGGLHPRMAARVRMVEEAVEAYAKALSVEAPAIATAIETKAAGNEINFMGGDPRRIGLQGYRPILFHRQSIRCSSLEGAALTAVDTLGPLAHACADLPSFVQYCPNR